MPKPLEPTLNHTSWNQFLAKYFLYKFKLVKKDLIFLELKKKNTCKSPGILLKIQYIV